MVTVQATRAASRRLAASLHAARPVMPVLMQIALAAATCRRRGNALSRALLRLLGLQFGHALAIEPDEIHRVDAQRRKARVHDGIGDDFAREREQEARALDHHDRMLVLLRNVLQPEHPGIDQLELEQHRAGAVGLALDLELDLDIGLGQRLGRHVDLNVDGGLLLVGLQRARRVWILERQVLDVLCQDVELRGRGLGAAGPGGLSAIGGHRHLCPPERSNLPERRQAYAWRVANTGRGRPTRMACAYGFGSCSGADGAGADGAGGSVSRHSSGARSTTSSRRPGCWNMRPTSRRNTRCTGPRSRARPSTSVKKPGSTRRIPPSATNTPDPLVAPANPSGPTRIWAIWPRPAPRSRKIPRTVVASIRASVARRPILTTRATKIASSASGRLMAANSTQRLGETRIQAVTRSSCSREHDPGAQRAPKADMGFRKIGRAS